MSTVCLSVLDLSFLKNPLPKHPKRKQHPYALKRSDLPSPYFVGDIKPFISVVGANPELISSRKHLRDHERACNVRQAGGFKPGEIAAENETRYAESRKEAATVDHGWVDFED